MKRTAGIVSVWLCMVGLALGGTLGDVNGDGAVGLPEAIHALQVTSGIRPLGAVQTYDIADYFYIEGGNYEFRRTNFIYSTSPGASQKYVYDTVISVVKETVDGKELLLVGGSDYFLTDPTGLLYKGYRASTSSGYEPRWLTPSVLQGSRKMTPGDLFTTFYEDPGVPGQLYYRELLFVGTEDVAVPAGLFSECMKILRRTHTPTSIRVDVQHWARGVGLVKNSTIYYGSGSNYIQELVGAKVGSNVYPSNAAFYLGSGVWNGTVNGQTSGPGALTLRFNLTTLPAWGMLTLTGFNTPWDANMPLVSQDGIHFSLWSSTAIASPDVFSLTVSGGTISGIYQPSTGTVVTLTGTYSAIP